MSGAEVARFEEAVASIRRQFPGLRIEVRSGEPNYHAIADIPAQPPHLDFKVNINLQNDDELHLNASHLWAEWFPCGDERVFQDFITAVSGLLSGRFRIVESFVGGRAVKAVLQRPTDAGKWENVAAWRNLGSFLPWRRTRRVVQNRSSA